jgi:hypothetical protein
VLVSKVSAHSHLSQVLDFDHPVVDKLEQMLGSYGPHPQGEPYTKNFDVEESPSGIVARSGSYSVRSRVVDDDGEVYAGLYSQKLLSKSLQTDLPSFQTGSGRLNLPRSGK